MSKQGKLIMSFHQGGKVTDSKGKKVKATAVQKKAIQATKKKCKAPKPVAVIKHSSSGVPVVSHCRGKRAGRGGGAVASEPKRVGQTKGALSNATLKALGKAPAKKAPAKKVGLSVARARTQAYKDEVAKLKQEYPDAKVSKLGKGLSGIGYTRNSFEFSSDKAGGSGHRFIDNDDVRRYMADGVNPTPAPAPPATKVIKVRRARAKRAGETKGGLSKAVLKGIGKEPAKKKIKVKGTRALRAGETKGALSERVAGSLARAREQKQRGSNPSMGYA